MNWISVGRASTFVLLAVWCRLVYRSISNSRYLTLELVSIEHDLDLSRSRLDLRLVATLVFIGRKLGFIQSAPALRLGANRT